MTSEDEAIVNHLVDVADRAIMDGKVVSLVLAGREKPLSIATIQYGTRAIVVTDHTPTMHYLHPKTLVGVDVGPSARRG